jgi:hypothetical protein
MFPPQGIFKTTSCEQICTTDITTTAATIAFATPIANAITITAINRG